jgi:predicted permease
LVDLVGRLEPDGTRAGAEAELTAFFSRADAALRTPNVRAVARALPRVILGNTRPAVLIFAAAAALLLVIACLNVANVIIVRGLARTRELAVRSALGASRWQIIAQLLAENGLLAGAGGVVGVGLAAIAVSFLIRLAPADVPLLDTVHFDPRVLGGALGLTAAAMLLFGVTPALVAARTDAHAVLRAGARLSASRRSRLTRELLVGAQVALAVLVLAAAALLGRSMLKLANADLHFDDSQLLIAELGMRYDKYDDVNKQRAAVDLVLASVRAAPGVRTVSPVLTVPFSGAGGWDAQAATDGQSVDEAAHNAMFNLELVAPDYFPALGIDAVRGRLLMPSDEKGSEPVAVVSESMAHRYWPNENPIGKRLRMGKRPERSATVVGVVADTRYRDLRDLRATAYFPLAQSTFTFAPTALAIRTWVAPATVVAEVRRAISEAAPGVFLANAAPFASFEAAPLAQPRLNAFLLLIFALSAALLAGVGLFATMATLVRQRTHEFGVRMALGATARDVQSLMMRRGLTLAAAGVGIGLTIALPTNRLLSSLLFEVTPTDPATLIGAGSFLLIIGLIATLVPARTGARTEPALALRSET